MFIGTTRFSLFQPGSNAWNLTKRATDNSGPSLEDLLYAPERIEPRLDIFINLSLPLIASAASEHLIKHTVLYSDEMPSKYKSQLEDAAQEYEFLVLNKHVDGKPDPRIPGPHMSAKKHFGDNATYGIYRLDDDDLLAVNFFNEASRYLNPEFAGMRLSFASGVTGLYEDGKFSYLKATYHPMIAIGLMSICHRVDAHTIVQPADAPHILSDRYDPVVVDARQPMFFWTRHADQDTDFGTGVSKKAAREKILKELNARTSVDDTDEVSKLFPTIEERLQVTVFEPLSTEDVQVGDLPVSLPIPACARVIELKLTVDAPEGNPPRGGLVAFEFERIDGGRLDVEEVAVEGLNLSPNPGIGWYKYLATSGGTTSQTVTVSIASMHRIKRIRLMKFGPGAMNYTIRDLKFGVVE